MIYNRQRPHSAVKYLTPAQYEDKNPPLYFNVVSLNGKRMCERPIFVIHSNNISHQARSFL